MSGGTVYRGGRYADEDPTAVLPVVPGAAGVIGYEANPTVVLPPVPPGPAAPSGPPVAAPPPAPRAAPAETLAAPDITGSVARNSAIMALGSMVSRVTGFLRTAALGAALGAAAVSDDYNLANMLPEIFFYGIAALLAAILNTRGHFAAPMWAPILNNIVVITTAAVFLLLPGSPIAAESVPTAKILVLGIGTTLGIVVQAAGLFPALRKVGFRWRWRWDFRALRLGELARVSVWMLAYVIVSQLGLVVVLKIAKLAGDKAGPGPAIFNNAFLIFMMAHGIVAVSIITALMPRMSRAAAEHRYPDVAAQLSLGIRLSAVILVPATAAYLVLGRALGVTLFEWKHYTHPQAVATGWVIAVAGLGLVPFAIGQLQIFAFYALPDTKTPALVNIPVVLLRVVADVLFWLVLPTAWVAAGLMAGNAISFVGSLLLGFALLRRRIGLLGMSRVAATLARLGLAAAVAAVPTWLVVYLLDRALGDDKLGNAVQLVVGGVVLLAAYVGMAFALRVREVSELFGMVRGRLGR